MDRFHPAGRRPEERKVTIAPFSLQETTGGKVAFWVPQRPPRARYQIDCAIDFADRVSLSGRCTIHLVNTTPEPLQTLAIDFTALRFVQDDTLRRD